MGFRGRGGFRGAPRGASRGGVRGRGGGSRGRGRARPAFDSARLAEEEDEDTEDDTASEADLSGQSQNESDSDDDDEELRASQARSYTALMQSLADDAQPRTKKRKLDHKETFAKAQEAEAEAEFVENPDLDQVEEPEEGPETAVDGQLDDADADADDEADRADPFETHFASPDEDVLEKGLKAIQLDQWTIQKSSLPKAGKAIRSMPRNEGDKSALPLPISGPSGLKLKQKLAMVMERERPVFDELERTIAPCIFSYQDLLYCERTVAAASKLRRLVCLHAVNHIFKTRDRVIKNNAKLAKEAGNDDFDIRDQGFTRPKVVIISPTRESCVRMVKAITSVCEPEQQENRKRFDESFVDKREDISTDKPEDFKDLFAGNDDDMFRIGLKFTRKTIKFFAQFYNSDIILASPLGLRMAIGAEGSKKLDYDFLSSVEVVVVDQAEALLMQNWDHMEFIFEHMNLQPKEAHGCDFSRVRSWYLDNNASFFRQTIALTSFNTPELNTLFYNRSKNWSGKIKVQRTYTGAIQELGLKVRQTYSRLDAPSFQAEPDARFAYFATTILPSLAKHIKDVAGTLIFIPSYLDFVRVRNQFLTSATAANISFASISEYTSSKDVARARSHFVSGRHTVLLYTERAHHFRRYRLKGVRKVIMYGLPDNPTFYRELVDDYLARSVREGTIAQNDVRVRAIFSKWDVLKLERIVGTDRVAKMIKDRGDTFDFV